MRRWLAFAPLGVLALLGVLFAGYGLQRDPEVKPDALVGQPVPAVTLPSLEGGEARPLRAGEGPLVINLFASWCGPCQIEHPELVRMQEAGVTIVGVAYKDDPVDTLAFLNRLGNPYQQVLVDRQGDVGIELGLSGVPETFLADRGGVIIAKHSGPLSRQDANRLLERIEDLR